MKNKRLTIVQSALQTIDGFEQVFKVIKQNTVLQGKSLSTFNNYIRRIAIISLDFDRLPEDISDDDLKDYLTGLALSSKSPNENPRDYSKNTFTSKVSLP